MSGEIPEFTDDLAHCDPCGYPDADTTYVPASLMPGDLERLMNPFGGRWPVFAFLKRTCLRCGFQWAEAPLSPQQPDQPELCGDRSAGGPPCNLQAGHLSPHVSSHPCPAPAVLGMKCSLPAGHRSPHQWGLSFS